MSGELVRVDNLSKEFPLRSSLLGTLLGRPGATLKAVDDISFSIDAGQCLGLVGESGSGKTTTGKLLMRLEDPTRGAIRFAGDDVSALAGTALRTFRRNVQMIFQNPFESLDPRLTIGTSVARPLALHGIGTGEERRRRAETALDQVDLKPVRNFIDRYPRDLSGGQLQRGSIARALILSPKLIVADEPVSMLDVSVRSGVMNLMLKLQAELGVSYLYITHDLAVARHMSSRIAVMYLGRIVEEGPVDDVVGRGGHPYTRLLVAAVPEPHTGAPRARVKLRDEAADTKAIPSGCRFHPRCPLARAKCRDVEPPPVRLASGHWAACHFAGEVQGRGLGAAPQGAPLRPADQAMPA